MFRLTNTYIGGQMNNKISLLNSLLKIIENISDSEYQKRVWLQGKGPECSDFDEAMCNFFDDFHAKDIIKNYKTFNVSYSQYQILSEFYKILEKYSNKTPLIEDTEKILLDPEWHKIQKLAKKVLESFDHKTSSNP